MKKHISSILLSFLICLLFSTNVNATELNESVSNNQISEMTENDSNSLSELEIEGNVIDSGWNNDIFWSLDSDGTLTITGHGDLDRSLCSMDNPGTPWDKYRDQITALYVDVYDVNDADYWFYMFSNLHTVNIVRMNMTETYWNDASLRFLFAGCSSLENLNLEHMDTSGVDDMYGMFLGCRSLKNLDVSNFNTEKVRNTGAMFYNCRSITYLSLSNWQVNNVTTMLGMFTACVSLQEIDLEGWNTKSLETMNSMFGYCSSLQTLDLSHFDTSNVTDMGCLFDNCENLCSLDISGWDTKKVENMNGMFGGCSLQTLDLSHFDTRNVTDMSLMFGRCKELHSLDISGWDTKKVENMNGMFSECSLQTLDLSHFDTSNVTNMGFMFSECKNLHSLDISSWDTKNVENMNGMFMGCSLQTLDLSHFDTGNVTDMSIMFERCSGLRFLDVSSFNYSNPNVSFNEAAFEHLGNLDTLILPANMNVALRLPSWIQNETGYIYIDKNYYGPDGQIHDTAITGLPYKAVYSTYPNYAFVQGFASRMYTTVLNRPAESEGLHYWTMALINQEVDGAGIAKGFIYSDEFKNRNLNNSDYVDVLYRTFFDREPDAEGKNYWMSLLSGGTNRYYILSQFVNSQEFSEICSMYGINRGVIWASSVNEKGVRDFVLRMYTKALNREGETDGVNYWSECIITAESTPEEVAKNFFSSQEFINRNLSDADYVETLYQTFMNRASESSGKAYWMQLLNSGVSRTEILEEFARSQEFNGIMAGYGL